MKMLKYLMPIVNPYEVPAMLLVAVIGAMVAGLYGALHDQVTYTLSPEYFTKLKFVQFADADWGLGDRVFASTIGFLATWWVGAIAGWLVGRWYIPGQSRSVAYGQIARAIGCMTLVCFLFGLAAFLYGWLVGPDADFSGWEWAFRRFEITDRWSFVRVAYIHNAGYLGGLVGLVVAFIVVRRQPATGTTV